MDERIEPPQIGEDSPVLKTQLPPDEYNQETIETNEDVQLQEAAVRFGPASDASEAPEPQDESNAPTGSILDLDRGVFHPLGTHSCWEQFAEQTFHTPQEAMYQGISEMDGILFGPAPPRNFSHKTPYDHHVEKSFVQPSQPFFSTNDDPADDPIPNDPEPSNSYDPLFARQWYLQSAPTGINVVTAWQDYTGDGIKVAVCDCGIDYTHPDLAINYLSHLDYNATLGIPDGKPQSAADKHGTTVAGYIGAAKNNWGIMGVAYESGITSLIGDTDAQAKAALLKGLATDIVSNSWTFDPYDLAPEVDSALQTLATNGRGGLGTVVTFCSSNEREETIMSNAYTMNNSPYTLSVGATNSSGEYAYFSSAGPNVLVTAPGVNVIGTDREPGGYLEGSYHVEVDASGTSYSTPIVSGTIALMLEANPNLGYRDVFTILAYTAVRTPSMPGTSNNADNWNGGGLHGNNDYGFGLVDATAAVRLAESWDQGAHTAANQLIIPITTSVGSVISTQPANTITSVASISGDIEVQQALVTVDISNCALDQLVIKLISPEGTESVLLAGTTYEGIANYFTQNNTPITASELINSSTTTFGDTNVWTFKTVLAMGEDGHGNWELQVSDSAVHRAGTLNSWTLQLYGDSDSANDLYVYTNEFSDVAGDTGRTTLSDGSGHDTINASTVSSDSSIDLTPGSVSTIDGVALTIDSGTTIENVHSGDGNDILTGNTADNTLFGWRGNDTIYGKGGSDKLVGGAGKDLLSGGSGSDLFHYGDAAEGGDTISDFNHADDNMTFDYSAFGQSSSGALAADHFFTSSASVDVSDACFIYENDALWYDADGTGDQAAQLIAQVTGDSIQDTDIQFV